MRRSKFLSFPSREYLQFRYRFTNHVLAEVSAASRSIAMLVAMLLGPMLLGLVAIAALPLLFAPTRSFLEAGAIVGLQSMILAYPLWLLRKKILPEDLVRWIRALPISSAEEFWADVAVTWICLRPLALVYLISVGIWLGIAPPWLQSTEWLGLLLTLLSFACTLILSSAALWVHCRQAKLTSPSPKTSSLVKPGAILLGHHLFGLPFWRGEAKVVAWRQSVCLLLSMVCVAVWILRPPSPGIDQPITIWFCFFANTFWILLTLGGSNAFHRQLQLLRPIWANWPIQTARFEVAVRFLSLLPSFLVFFIFAALVSIDFQNIRPHVLWLYMGTQILAQLVLALGLGLSQKNRVVFIVLAIAILTAIGSELWR